MVLVGEAPSQGDRPALAGIPLSRLTRRRPRRGGRERAGCGGACAARRPRYGGYGTSAPLGAHARERRRLPDEDELPDGEDRTLVSKHDDLELLELTRTQTQRRHRRRTPKQQIHQRHDQGQTPSTRLQTRPDTTAAQSAPTRLRAASRIYAPDTDLQPDRIREPSGSARAARSGSGRRFLLAVPWLPARPRTRRSRPRSASCGGRCRRGRCGGRTRRRRRRRG